MAVEVTSQVHAGFDFPGLLDCKTGSTTLCIGLSGVVLGECNSYNMLRPSRLSWVGCGPTT